MGGGGGKKDAGGDAADVQTEFLQKGIDELRRQFDSTSEDLDPFIQAGTGALGDVQQGATIPGFADRLSQIFDTDIFSTLVDERTRSTQGQLAAGGLTRSGTGVSAIADIPSSLGLQIEQLLSGRSTDLANSGASSAARLGGIGANTSSQISQLFGQQGSAQSSGILSDAQARAAGTSQILNLGGSVLSSLPFSDPRLKENAEVIGKIGPLELYEWDWIPAAKGTVIEKCPKIGFMADSVSQHYPEYAGQYCGWQYIHYGALLEKLEVEYGDPKCRH